MVSGIKKLVLVLAALATLVAAASAQQVISAKSGLINYVDGKVFLDGNPVEPDGNDFTQMTNDSVLRTTVGRVEVLLSPGVFLRLGEDAAVRLVSGELTDTVVELISGPVLVECSGMVKGNKVTFSYGKDSVLLKKNGLYRFNTDPAELRVYKGRAEVFSPGGIVKAKGGNAVSLEGSLITNKFDTKKKDAFHRWSKDRGEYIAMVNLSAEMAAYNRNRPAAFWPSQSPFGFQHQTFPDWGGQFAPAFRFWIPINSWDPTRHPLSGESGPNGMH